MLDDVLSYSLPTYMSLGMDVIVYDSSDNDDTKKVVSKLIQDGFENLSYIHTKSEECLDYKLLHIFQHDGNLKKYSYIWLMNDSMTIFPTALNHIAAYMEEDYDMIRLPSAGFGEATDSVYTDANDWFLYASRNMAHMATTIMNSRLLCGKINWDKLREKYIGTNDITDVNHGFFFTVGFYLERIATLEKFRGLLIGNGMRWWRESHLKQGKSYWQKYIFETWARSYCETIFALPECYQEKEKVIAYSDNIHCGRFGEQSLISYRIQGDFSLEHLVRYKKYWPLITNVSLERIRKIAATPIEELQKKYGVHYGELTYWQDNLSSIEKELGNNAVVVYGAGLYGNNVVRKLLDDGYRNLMVAVSDVSKNPSDIEGVPVKCVMDILDQKEDVTVIVAMMPDPAMEVKKYLKKLGFKHITMLF